MHVALGIGDFSHADEQFAPFIRGPGSNESIAEIVYIDIIAKEDMLPGFFKFWGKYMPFRISSGIECKQLNGQVSSSYRLVIHDSNFSSSFIECDVWNKSISFIG